MATRRALVPSVVVSWIVAMAAANMAQALEPPFSPPTATIYSKDFEGVHGIPASWQAALGSWNADGQTYNSVAATSAAITTIFEYQPIDPIAPIEDALNVDEFRFAARLRSDQARATALVGLVYIYLDPSNYSEVAFSPTGIAYLRRMSGGSLQTLATAAYPGAGQGMWLSVELKRTANTTSVIVNGVPIFNQVAESFDHAGQVGLSTYNTTGRFNKVSISLPFEQQPFTDNFADGVADGFTSPEGTFAVSNGVYIDTAVHKTGRSFAPVFFGGGASTIIDYTARARMLNPFGGSGNLMGFVFDTGIVDSKPAYQEVVFSPTGVAQIRRVVGDTIQVLSSAPVSVGRNQWFEVTILVGLGGVLVYVNDEPLAISAPLLVGLPNALGLVTHWTPGRFDNFEFEIGADAPLQPLLRTFDHPLRDGEIRSGSWNTDGRTLNDVSAGISDVVLPTGMIAGTDYHYKARLLNEYGASGNLVGLIFSYQSTEDYLEIVFAPTGQAYLNLVMEGTKYHLATGTHNVPRNVWFDVELIRRDTRATVTMNGMPLFQNAQVGQLNGGALGVVSHWAKSRFDNLATNRLQ